MLVRNALAYSGTNVVSQAARFLQEFVIRRILPPELLGVWNFSTVIQNFVTSFDLGIVDASYRELPVLHGSGKQEEEITCRSTAFWSKVAQQALLSLGILLYTLFYRNHYNVLYLTSLAAASIIVALSSIRDSFIPFYQTTQRYVPLSKVLVVSALWNAFTIPAGALLGGIVGLIVAAVIGVAVQGVFLYQAAVREGLRVHLMWDWGFFKRLLGFGLPLRVVDYPQQILSMSDVLVVTSFMGVESLAIYSTAKALVSQAQEIISRVGNVFVMRMFNLSGRNVDRGVLAAELMRFLFFSYLILVPIVIVGVIHLVSFFVAHLIPKYVASVPVLQILAFAIYFTPQTTLVRNLWVLDKRLVSIGVSNLIGLVGLIASVSGAVMYRGFRVESVALGVVVGYGLYFLYLMFSVGREIWGLKGAIRIVAYVSLSVSYTAVILLSVGTTVVSGNVVSGGLAAWVRFTASVLLLVPLVYLGLVKSKSVTHVGFGKDLMRRVLTGKQYATLADIRRRSTDLMGRMLVSPVKMLPDRLLVRLRNKVNIVRKMDYQRRDILLNIDSEFTYTVRLNSCANEPETVEWIETFLKEGEVFFDVGANVGAYSLVAAKLFDRKITVYAFEPAFINFHQLCKNIFLNNCRESVIPLPIALSDKTVIGDFNYQNLVPGAALHVFGEAIDFQGDGFEPVFRLSTLSYSIDDLIRQFGLPVPNHIKIDVDGQELSVLRGADETLSNPAVRSISVELSRAKRGAIDFLGQKGFQVYSSRVRGAEIAATADEKYYNCILYRAPVSQ